ncbi:MAG TPA: hypothetical protein VF551_07695 [Chthoniobacterales bacterium]
MKRFLPGLPLLFAVSTLLAQEASPAGGDDAAAAGAAAFAGLGCSCIIMVVALAIQVAMTIFVYRDGKARGMDNVILLTVVTAFTGLIGLIIHLVTRPKTKLPPGQSAP